MLQPRVGQKSDLNGTGELQQAFSDFNAISNHLSDVYTNLEKQVDALNSELGLAREHGAEQYEEKEKIARRLQNLLKVLPAGIIVLDKDGAIKEHNPAAENLFGDSLNGNSWRSIVERSFSPRWDDGHDVTLKDGRCVNISTQALEDESGQLILVKEVSETKRLQQQLDRLKRLSAMGDMASSLAHQIRTPLSTALLYASHLRRVDLDEERQTRFVNKLMGRLQHLESLIEDMLMFARGGRFDSKPVAVDLLLIEFSESVESHIKQTGTMLDIDNKSNGNILDINCNAIISVFQNLLNNAIYASENIITIKLSVEMINDNYLEFRFADNGPGIETELHEKIFEPFYTTHEEGTGLGLTVAEAVIRAHGGNIKLESTIGKGSCFRICLPVVN